MILNFDCDFFQAHLKQHRLAFAVLVSMLVHGAMVVPMWQQPSRSISADVMSLPTAVRVSFKTPPEAEPISAPVTEAVPEKTIPTLKKVEKIENSKETVTQQERTQKNEEENAHILEKNTELEENSIPIISNATYLGTRTPPEYPNRALRLQQEGVVLVYVLLSPDGIKKKVEVRTTSGYQLLDKAAIDAVRKWTFAPTVDAGKPILSWVEVPVEFMIKK